MRWISIHLVVGRKFAALLSYVLWMVMGGAAASAQPSADSSAQSLDHAAQPVVVDQAESSQPYTLLEIMGKSIFGKPDPELLTARELRC